MRRLVLFFLVAALVILPFGFVGRIASAQGTPEVDTSSVANCTPGRVPTEEESAQLVELEPPFDYLAWEGVCEPIPDGEPIAPSELPQIADLQESQAEPLLGAFNELLEENPDFAFQPYAVAFTEDHAATIPIRDKLEVGESTDEETRAAREAEFMVVLVVQGQFVLDVLPDNENGDKQVLVTTENEEFQLTAPWDENAPEPHYTVIEDAEVFLEDENGDRCTRACVVTPGEPVLLKQGDYAIAEQGVICRYCLEEGEIDDNGIDGLLQVFALKSSDPDTVNDFSWTQSWLTINPQEVRRSEPPTKFGWAFPNLSTGCKDR